MCVYVCVLSQPFLASPLLISAYNPPLSPSPILPSTQSLLGFLPVFLLSSAVCITLSPVSSMKSLLYTQNTFHYYTEHASVSYTKLYTAAKLDQCFHVSLSANGVFEDVGFVHLSLGYLWYINSESTIYYYIIIYYLFFFIPGCGERAGGQHPAKVAACQCSRSRSDSECCQAHRHPGLGA